MRAAEKHIVIHYSQEATACLSAGSPVKWCSLHSDCIWSHISFIPRSPLLQLWGNTQVLASWAICEPCTLLKAKRAAWSNHCTQFQFITSKDLEQFTLCSPRWLDEGKGLLGKGVPRALSPLPSLPFLFNLHSPFNFRSPSWRMLVKWVHLNKPVGG